MTKDGMASNRAERIKKLIILKREKNKEIGQHSIYCYSISYIAYGLFYARN